MQASYCSAPHNILQNVETVQVELVSLFEFIGVAIIL